jgi:transposase-like protein
MEGKAKRYAPEFKERAARKVVKDYRKRLLRQPLPQDIPTQVRIRELERRNRELEVENAFLKNCSRLPFTPARPG